MTFYIAVDGADPETLDAADDELIAETVHRLLREEMLVQDIETVGIIENLEDELDGAVISKESLQIFTDDASQTLDGPDLDPEYHTSLSEAWNEAHNALYDNGDSND